jgi:hypothetical protein
LPFNDRSTIEQGRIMARKSMKKPFEKYVPFTGRMVMLGFGSIGQGVLPLILRHIAIKPSQITIIAEEMRGGEGEAKRFGVEFIEKRLTPANYRSVLASRLGKGDFLVNRRSRSPRPRWSSSARRRALSISTPASSRGRAATPTPNCRYRGARTMRSATRC